MLTMYEVLYEESIFTRNPNTAVINLKAYSSIEAMKQAIILCKGDCHPISTRVLTKNENGVYE